jgi:hypothetical protein
LKASESLILKPLSPTKMRTRFVRSGYFRCLSHNNFVENARAVQQALSQEVFASVQPNPGLILLLLDEMQRLIGDPTATFGLRSKLDVVRGFITQLLDMQATAVNKLAQGDMNLLQASGFELDEEPVHSMQKEWNDEMMVIRTDDMRNSA